jgi:pyruvate/2-oxoglutarate dehydrogenase complex dihydrolipoamide dehydrogenase (E3) component
VRRRVDVVVVGAGGTGSDVCTALARAGLSVVMAEREVLGGECSHFGCDPTKALLKSARVAALARRGEEFGIHIPVVEPDFGRAVERARHLIEEETAAGAAPYEALGATVLLQEARVIGEHLVEVADGTQFEAAHIVLTTGSESTAPPIPGLEGGGFWTNREAVWHGEGLPGSLFVLGGGAIGVEFAQIYARFGCDVTLVEAAPRILSVEDADSSAAMAECLREEGVHLHTGQRAIQVDGPSDTRGGWRIEFEGGAHDVLTADRLLVATGRRPVFDGHDLEAAGVELGDHGRPKLTETLRTTSPHIWVGGDATGEQLFTHVGGYEAEVIAADILGRPFPRDYRVVPRVTFSEPEVASVGLTEEQARDKGLRVRVAAAPFDHNPRSFLEGEMAGHVKLMADERTGLLVGGHIVGELAGELIHEVVAIMAGGVTTKVAAGAIHAYPTRSEAVRSALRQLGE